MSKPIIKANLKGSDRVELVYNDRTVEMTITDFFNNLPASTLVISNTPSPATSGIYSGSGYLPGNITVNGLSGYTIYFTAIDEFKVFANKFLLENGECTFTSGSYEGTINIDTLTANRTYTLPDITGEIQVGPAVKKYKALISQNAPIASQTSGTFIVGQIVEILDYSVNGDLSGGDDFSNWNLISGTENTTGAIYQVTTPTPTRWDFLSELAYDGAPYVVSTDVNGDFNPFVNTLGEDLIFEYDSTGIYLIKSSGIFENNKTIVRPIQTTASGVASKSIIVKIVDNDTDITIYSTNDGSTPADGELYYTLVEIEVNP